MKNLIIFSLIIALFSVIFHPLAQAASPTPSPSPSPSPISDETITENLKKRLQETLVDQTAPSTGSYRSFVGVIRDVIKSTLIVEDKDGKKNIMIAENASIVRSPGNITIKAENIRIEDYVIAIGELKESDELEAIRVIVSTSPLSLTNKKTGAAKITKINKNDLTIATLLGGESRVITITSKTKLKTSLGDSLEATELSVGDSIIYAAQESKDILTATTLMRIGFADAPDASPSTIPDSN